MAVAPGGGEVFALAIDPEDALLEYLEMFYNLRRAGRALRKMGAIDFATTIAPGLRDVLLTGKAKEAVRRKKDGEHVYDAVVMDAPPTGRIARFLNVNTEVAGLARTGPIRNQADDVMAVIALAAHRRAPGDAARGDAGAGDRRRRARPARRAGCPSAGSSSTRCAARCSPGGAGQGAHAASSTPTSIAADLGRVGDRSRRPARSSGSHGGGDHRRGRRGARARGRRARRAGGARSSGSATTCRRSSGRRTSSRSSPDGIDVGTLYDLADLLREQGMA